MHIHTSTALRNAEHETGHTHVKIGTSSEPLLTPLGNNIPQFETSNTESNTRELDNLALEFSSQWALEWLREWRIMNALTNKRYAVIVLAIMMVQLVFYAGILTWHACSTIVENGWKGLDDSATIDCASSVGTLMLSTCPVFMLWSLQTIMVIPGPLAKLCELCPGVHEESKLWFAKIRAGLVGGVSLLAGAILFYYFVRAAIVLANGESTNECRIWADSASPAPWLRLVFILLQANQVLAIIVNAIVGFTWILSILLATTLIQNSCEKLGKVIKHSTTMVVASEAEWDATVRVPFTELATTLIPLLSNTWGITLGIVATCVLGFVVGKLPMSLFRGFSSGVLLVFIPCILGGIPGKISTSYRALLTQISELRWTFDKDMIHRVEDIENVTKNFTVGFKVGGVVVSIKRMKGLAISLAGTSATIMAVVSNVTRNLATPGPTSVPTMAPTPLPTL